MRQMIKFAAVAFALCLATSIIGGCVFGVVNVVRLIVDTSEEYYYDETTEFMGIRFASSEEVESGAEVFPAAEITKLDMEYGSGTLVVETWAEDTISVEYENLPKRYQLGVENDKFYIRKEDSIWIFSWFLFSASPKVTVKVPYTMYEKVVIEKGSGSTVLRNINMQKLQVDSGSGSMELEDVTVHHTDIDMGSGGFYVSNSNLGRVDLDMGSGTCTMEEVVAENLDMDSGSGRISYMGKLTGNCVFETGSGSVSLEIYGFESDYNIRTDMGSGSLYINGRKEKNEEITYAGAENLLVFDAGSGRVSINFLRETE